MPGPPRKPADERQRRNHYPSLGTPAVPEGPVPKPPDGIRPSLVAEWVGYWGTPVAGLLSPATVGGLRRLFELKERSARAGDLFEATDDPTYARLATTIDAEIRQLEDRYGMNLRAQLNLGIELDEAERAEESRRRRREEDGVEEEQRADPRLADAIPATSHARPAGGEVDGAAPRPRRGRSRG